jgi:hypothetical protein
MARSLQRRGFLAFGSAGFSPFGGAQRSMRCGAVRRACSMSAQRCSWYPHATPLPDQAAPHPAPSQCRTEHGIPSGSFLIGARQLPPPPSPGSALTCCAMLAPNPIPTAARPMHTGSWSRAELVGCLRCYRCAQGRPEGGRRKAAAPELTRSRSTARLLLRLLSLQAGSCTDIR